MGPLIDIEPVPDLRTEEKGLLRVSSEIRGGTTCCSDRLCRRHPGHAPFLNSRGEQGSIKSRKRIEEA